jgi:Spy/CpxP family protein refolding chaperone
MKLMRNGSRERLSFCVFSDKMVSMPTITIDIPDGLNIPSNWDVQTFVLEKMYEAGILTSKKETPVEVKTESWFTPEQHAQFRENRRRLEEAEAKNPRTKEDRERLHNILLNFPVADEEDIKRQDEVREHMRQWKLPEY